MCRTCLWYLWYLSHMTFDECTCISNHACGRANTPWQPHEQEECGLWRVLVVCERDARQSRSCSTKNTIHRHTHSQDTHTQTKHRQHTDNTQTTHTQNNNRTHTQTTHRQHADTHTHIQARTHTHLPAFSMSQTDWHTCFRAAFNLWRFPFPC